MFLTPSAGDEALAALRAFDLLRIDAADSVRRNSVSAFCADRVERRLNFFEIDFRLPGHFPTLAWGDLGLLLPRDARASTVTRVT